MLNGTPAVLCGENFQTSITHIVLLECFKAVYKIKKFSADASKESQVSFFFNMQKIKLTI